MRKSKRKLSGKKPIYQDFTRIDATRCAIRALVGGRRIGKTWGCRSKMIECAAEGRKFVYLRKNHSMVTLAKMRTLFTKQDKEAEAKLGGVIDYSRGQMAFVVEGSDEPIGWATSLEDAYNIKGSDFPGTKIIFFDEFLDDAPMAGEFDAFQNVIATITALSDDIVVYMATNTIARDNVYFRNFGIDIGKMHPGDIAVVNHLLGATVAVEYCRSNVYKDPSTGMVANKYIGFDHSDTTRMIMFGEWTHPPIETREIDGTGWNCKRYVLPALVYIQGKYYEMSISTEKEIAFVRTINCNCREIPGFVQRIVTAEFTNTFTHYDGRIVPKWLSFLAIDSEELTLAVKFFKRCRAGGRIIGIDPVDTHDFLRFFDTMPI